MPAVIRRHLFEIILHRPDSGNVSRYLGRAPKDLVAATNAGSDLVVLRFSMAGRVELGLSKGISQIHRVYALKQLTSDASSEPPNQTA